jgi:heme A synthase
MTHFTAAATFAFFASIVLGITQRSQPRQMVRYGIFCFVLFLAVVIVGSWLMRLIHA